MSARASGTVNKQKAGVKSFAEKASAQFQKAKSQIAEIKARIKGEAE